MPQTKQTSITEEQALSWLQERKEYLSLAVIAAHIGWARPDLSKWVAGKDRYDGRRLKIPHPQFLKLVEFIEFMRGA